MKTLFALFYTFGITAGAASLDLHRLDPGMIFTALAVGALFALALNDGCRVRRPLVVAPVARFPRAARRVDSADLAA
ncbi:MAG TPA: hypothetical protein VMD31_13045 [Opitutaceae bacterium]|nr:hypothetical protein [Opitutaceae bacterium]